MEILKTAHLDYQSDSTPYYLFVANWLISVSQLPHLSIMYKATYCTMFSKGLEWDDSAVFSTLPGPS